MPHAGYQILAKKFIIKIAFAYISLNDLICKKQFYVGIINNYCPEKKNSKEHSKTK